MITALYVPGDRPDRFGKAAASGADAIILDLEDAVSSEQKSLARDAVGAWLSGPRPETAVQVRINAATPEDLTLLTGLGAAVRDITVRVPKVASARDLDTVLDRLDVPLIAIIEDAAGVEAAVEIARHPAVVGLALGEQDLASDLGVRSREVIDYARLRLVFAARAAGKPAPMIGVWAGIGDDDALESDTRRGRDLGMWGRTAIHPRQLAPIRRAFAPNEAELAWARQVTDALAAGGVARLASGEMADEAMRGRAEGILARADT